MSYTFGFHEQSGCSSTLSTPPGYATGYSRLVREACVFMIFQTCFELTCSLANVHLSVGARYFVDDICNLYNYNIDAELPVGTRGVGFLRGGKQESGHSCSAAGIDMNIEVRRRIFIHVTKRNYG